MSSDDIAAALDLTFDQLNAEFIVNGQDTQTTELIAKAIGLFCYHVGYRAGYKEGEEAQKLEEAEAKK